MENVHSRPTLTFSGFVYSGHGTEVAAIDDDYDDKAKLQEFCAVSRGSYAQESLKVPAHCSWVELEFKFLTKCPNFDGEQLSRNSSWKVFSEIARSSNANVI